MPKEKPMLTVEEQIEHLKDKNVLFNITTETEAIDYLHKNNNYFKLTSYRKNYQQHPDGKNKGKYVRLEFAYLIDLAVIDMRLRYQLVHMALDVEHNVKLQLLDKALEPGEDGYKIVEDYLSSLSQTQNEICNGEISRNKNNIYCGDIVNKYSNGFPLWAFQEIIPFGRLVDFYRFCGERYNDSQMKNNYFRLLTCKEIRNASAHSNCIINDLKSGTKQHSTNKDVSMELSKIGELRKNFRNLKMSNARLQQIVTLLYVHKEMVKSEGVHMVNAKKLHDIIERMYKNIDYYNTNNQIKSAFDFLKIIVDNWFKIA